MPTPDEIIDDQAQAQADWDAMEDAVRNRDVDGSFPLDCEPTEAQLQPEGGFSGGFADNH